ncbi:MULTISPECIES: FkbM family methyltransferase [Rhodopseudomonas]|uniref:Methyltransferase FkbM domain-containing protein n=1 Tax=Rhodopseudomonas palustris TaxID=1076 RepID=A0A0D7F2E2_RHOPL|nr:MULTISPECIES: FkbM family methyltransferase [Rhodopseudomonas]KIZ47031.1 hypothetical protein OO17_05745 [Rhodopseudomonas palustris]MDF3813996.1 FkbM family methyltransferase [Rhodopseudomonas sp. BAL398]WOK19956.1 FkbM family methyltransferase [Rhodopseudomonas sp. BAL398]
MSTKQIQIDAINLNLEGVTDNDPYFSELADDFGGDYYRLCSKVFKDNFISLDIGANIGVTSLIASRLQTKGIVHAFEPAQSVYSVLKRNIERNKASNVVPHNIALSDREGSAKFIDASAYGHVSETEGHDVQLTTVDNIVSSLDLPHVDFIKVDVEGHEPLVLKGAANTILRHSPLIYMEFNSWCLTAYGKTNSLEFAESILRDFAFVGIATSGGIRKLNQNGAFDFAKENMVLHGCVDDLLITNDPQKFGL